ncbi:unnamed protein product, partial [Mesorhabditis spiculigera]
MAVLLLLAATTEPSVLDRIPQPKDRILELDRKEMDRVWYIAAVRGLLKSKGRHEAKSVGRLEGIVFDECARNAKTVQKLAICVTHVLAERDRIKSQKITRPLPPSYYVTTRSEKRRRPLRRVRVNRKKRSMAPHEDPFEIDRLDRLERKLERIVNFSERSKRSVDSHRKLPKNVESLRRLQRYFEKVDHCNEYLRTMNDENQRTLRRLNVPLATETPRIEAASAAYSQILDLVNVFLEAEWKDSDDAMERWEQQEQILKAVGAATIGQVKHECFEGTIAAEQLPEEQRHGMKRLASENVQVESRHGKLEGHARRAAGSKTRIDYYWI